MHVRLHTVQAAKPPTGAGHGRTYRLGGSRLRSLRLPARLVGACIWRESVRAIAVTMNLARLGGARGPARSRHGQDSAVRRQGEPTFLRATAENDPIVPVILTHAALGNRCTSPMLLNERTDVLTAMGCPISLLRL